MIYSRRDFVRHSAAGVGLLTFTIAGCEKKLTPAEARRAQVEYRTLTAAEVATLEALGEGLLPGSASEGLAHYIDHQLSGPPENSMLMIKYLGVQPPFTSFYRGGLKALEAAAAGRFQKAFTQLSPDDANTLIGKIAAGEIPGWQGPPPGLFYFVLRSDAIDTLYGTQAGFEKLRVPYMAHILPPSRWGE
jgi:hypothetical protein